MKKFATALNCMDGRTQMPVFKEVQKLSGAEYVDMITEAGIDEIIASGTDAVLLEGIKKRIEISTENHGSKFIAVVGHDGCAGNPVDEATHRLHITTSCMILRKLYPKVTVVGLWVDAEFNTHTVDG